MLFDFCGFAVLDERILAVIQYCLYYCADLSWERWFAGSCVFLFQTFTFFNPKFLQFQLSLPEQLADVRISTEVVIIGAVFAIYVRLSIVDDIFLATRILPAFKCIGLPLTISVQGIS